MDELDDGPDPITVAALRARRGDRPAATAFVRATQADVWRLWHIPETNSLAVHVFRLRAKLAIAGFEGLVQTAPAGGYLLAPLPKEGPAIPLITPNSQLDEYIMADADGRVAKGVSP